MTLSYFRSDELPQWQATIEHNGTSPDFSSGWTFQVKVAEQATGTVVLTKTTNITGATGGVVTVAWASGELDVEPGRYRAQLKATRTSDGGEATVSELLTVKARD